MPAGTPVTLRGVVITAIDAYGARTGDFFVQDPAGGPFSGIKVFGAPLEQIAVLAPGDVVDISNAVKDEFALTSDLTGRTVTELKPVEGGTMTVTKVSSGSVPAPQVLDAVAIGQMDAAARDLEWEKWEGVLIRVNKARQLTDVRSFGQAADDQFEFRITGDARVQSAMSALPTDAAATSCYSVTGLGDYFFNWLVLPTASTGVATATDCAAEEEGQAACSDGVDNDADGFKDCQDRSCQLTVTTCGTSISAIQEGTATGVATVQGVYVTAISFNKKNLWVASSLTAAPNEGIFVFRGNNAATAELPAEIVVGAKVNVTGTVVENNNDQMGDTVTQLAGGPTVTFVEAPTTAPVPVSTQTAATLTDATMGEPYESVLVTLTNVKVLSVGDNMNFYVGSLQQGTTTFLSDDDILRLQATDVNKCFASVTGIWTYQVFSNAFGLLPISFVDGGTCN